MPQSKKPNFRLNLGEMDLTARITFTTNLHDAPMIEDFRAAAVKRYKGYLHDSIKCGLRPILARADHRSLNIAYGHQALPSQRTKRLLKALPRLDTGCSSREQKDEDSAPDYFSFCGGWERYVQRPSSPKDQDNFDWHSFMRADAEYALQSMQHYNAITEYNRVHLAKMLRTGGNVLLLDEPTNDLDVDTLRALEDALEAFPGCAVVISHDRWFLDRIATHILAFEGDSQVRWFEGNFSEYEAFRRKQLGAEADQPHRIRYKPLVR